ncbi:MAG: enoyl-CoA hydratase/isomerase family protein [Acidimicrobiales bacterium]
MTLPCTPRKRRERPSWATARSAERNDDTGIARLTIDNPTRKNAYDPAMRRALQRHLEDLAYDDTTKVVVLRGEGDAFSTG